MIIIKHSNLIDKYTTT